ncbi:serine/threonine-protein kinase [Rubrivirga marina]|uniref:Protein kinase domain-containing protein n=1 Tax=Rubrivirga marina TaxID=1196024 RepID=A0A271IZM0_9BACT|nr:serine/threonine-protein kinase [Rubrivirga marina]PAP76527.1 hypothetical protein BSZ37_08775 [Rubrivirga marina]
MDLRPGTLLGDYRLAARLGQGGMGTVFRAEHVRIGRVVALKVLRDPDLSARFLNEARIQAGLRHPNVATLYDYFECDGRACITMELIEGETLADRLRRGPLPWPEAVAVLRPIVEAVAYLHAHGVIHRDLKSHNVKVTPEGRVTLLDFGIAKELGAQGLTAGDAVPGTPEYLSPEQVRGRPPDARSDVWALGVLLYELLTGDVPFQAPSAFRLFERIARGEYAPPSARVRSVPPEADALVARCLRPDPAARFADAGAVLAALPSARRPDPTPEHALRSGPVRRARRPRPVLTRAHAGWVAAAVAALALVALVGRTLSDGPVAIDPPPAVAEAARPADAVPVGVTIDAVGPPAEVWRGGVRLGQTPLVIDSYVGEPVEVELRRDSAREPVRFETTAGKRAYTVTLPR